jgi:hypothetical protein
VLIFTGEAEYKRGIDFHQRDGIGQRYQFSPTEKDTSDVLIFTDELE